MIATPPDPRALDSSPLLGAVALWLAHRPALPGLAWLAVADDDGAVGLVPSGPASCAIPALLITAQPDGYAVTLCDPAAPEELGLFATVEDLLRALGRCMARLTVESHANTRLLQRHVNPDIMLHDHPP
jgi:hypothetical protein